ncbi:4-carboxymuconolactone decarboxylase family [Trichoderma cornu-damae]|uniref:4-carboxymuconolactone decarboxylase family n=1 Tax=Trichoderma cornu-damae TaxID=654480 RepID=A0A9P8U091_9HYPO|nr:4-carboxymuconolactone decarboxylase family [Trichoderma cornu-damae]
MRLPYVADPPPTQTAEDAAIVQRIRDRRAPRPLQALDLTLLHSAPVADGWNSFLGAVRTRTSLSDDVRELAISRVAVCNCAWYEWGHHAPLAVQGGVSADAMEAVKRDALGERPEGLLSEKQWAALVYADEMTKHVQVKDETFEVLRRHFNDQEVVEITATVAAYNCVSRFLVALDGELKLIIRIWKMKTFSSL